MVRSSRAKICPLMVTFLPSAAGPVPRGELCSGSKDLDGDDMLTGSLLGDSVAGAGEFGTPAGLCGCSSCLGLLHMRKGFSSIGSIQSYYCARSSAGRRVVPHRIHSRVLTRL